MRVLSIALLASVIAAAPQGMEGMGGMGGSKGGGGIPKSPKGAGGSPKGGGGGAPRAGSVSNDLLEGSCKDIFFIMARASTEPGNMGGTMGPIVCRGLRDIYKDRVGCQGVGGPYSAGLADNARPKGTTDGAINEAIKMFTTADTKCPKAILTFGGYSQGTAVMHNAVKALPPNIKKKTVAGVLFGDTRNTQDRQQVPDYPKDQVTIFCDSGDGVCKGTLSVTAGHMAYMANGDGPKAVKFLQSKIDAALPRSVKFRF